MYGTEITLYLYNLYGEGVTLAKEDTYTIYRFANRDKLYAIRMSKAEFEEDGDPREIVLGEVKINRIIYLPFSMSEKENQQKAIEKFLSQQTEEIAR